MTAPVPAPYAPQPPQAPAQPFQPPTGPWPGAYTSPIPAQNTNLGHALASEWTKIRTVRSTMWTLGVMLLLVLGVNLLVDLAYTAHDSAVSDPVLSPGLFGVMLGQLAVLTLGVMVMTSEYTTGMIRTTFTACPQRTRVLTAKAIVFFGLTFVLTSVACGVTGLINWAVLGGRSVNPADYSPDSGVVVVNGVTSASATEWIGATVGVGLYIALLGLLGLAVGTLLRHSAGAITTMMAVVLLPLLIAIFMPQSMRTVQEQLIKFSSPNALASLYRIPMTGDAHANGVVQLVSLAVVTALALVAAYAALAQRDV